MNPWTASSGEWVRPIDRLIAPDEAQEVLDAWAFEAFRCCEWQRHSAMIRMRTTLWLESK